MNAEEISKARTLRNDGESWSNIAASLGYSNGDTIRRALDPVWAERRRRMINEARQRKATGMAPSGRSRHSEAISVSHSQHDAEERLALIPDDTRDLTGRLLGDPLPGRSALDLMKCAQ